jgi:hypothetical protein
LVGTAILSGHQTERQRWITYATFGHTSAELSNPVSPAEDERDNLINVLPHAQFLEITRGAGKAFEAVLTAEQSSLKGETLWYRMVVGGGRVLRIARKQR